VSTTLYVRAVRGGSWSDRQRERAPPLRCECDGGLSRGQPPSRRSWARARHLHRNVRGGPKTLASAGSVRPRPFEDFQLPWPLSAAAPEPLDSGARFDGATGHLDGAERLTSAYGDYNLAGCDPDALIDFVIVTSPLPRASGV